MSFIDHRPVRQTFRGVACWVLLVLGGICSPCAYGAVLPLGAEQNAWSDMLLSNGGGTFSSGLLTISSFNGPANLEIGSQFGPGDSGWHYGPGGTRGGPTSASLIISRLFLNPDGTLKNNDSIVTLSYGGNSAGTLGADYGITNGTALLRGKVTEVLLDANGDDTLDILFTITGGELQRSPNAAPSIGSFAPGSIGLFRIAAPNLPSSWTSNFEFEASTLHVLGIPEPGTCVLACFAGICFRCRGRQW